MWGQPVAPQTSHVLKHFFLFLLETMFIQIQLIDYFLPTSCRHDGEMRRKLYFPNACYTYDGVGFAVSDSLHSWLIQFGRRYISFYYWWPFLVQDSIQPTLVLEWVMTVQQEDNFLDWKVYNILCTGQEKFPARTVVWRFHFPRQSLILTILRYQEVVHGTSRPWHIWLNSASIDWVQPLKPIWRSTRKKLEQVQSPSQLVYWAVSVKQCQFISSSVGEVFSYSKISKWSIHGL